MDPVGGGEIEFESNYRLLELGRQTLASPLTALGFPDLSAVRDARNSMDARLKKLESYSAQMKVFIAQESTNGEHFLQPLDGCRDVLERIIAVRHSKSADSSTSSDTLITISPSGLNYLRSTYRLIVEKILFYFRNIKLARREMGILLMDVLCLIVTLDQESRSIFPQVFGSCLLFFKPTADWKDAGMEIMNRLCYYILPKCLSCEQELCPWMNLSASIMMVLEACTATKDHLFIINTLMQLKKDVCSDILSALAYGTATIRQKSLDLLLYYWPIPIPEFSQRSNSINGEWFTPICENSSCRHKTSVASTLCLDPLCVAQYKQARPTKLYMLLCPECDSVIHGSPPQGDHMRLRVPKTLHDVKPNCEFQKICSGKDRQVNRAEVTCYDPHCTAIQHGQPIRMCRDCHNKQHKDISDPRHIYQVCPPDPWAQENSAFCTVMLEAISKLLETTPTRKDTPSSSRGVGTIPRSAGPHHVNYVPGSQIEVGVSREGVWLLSHYCTPTTTIRDNQLDWLVHLVALVLNWLQEYYHLLHSAAEEEGQVFSPGGTGGGDYVDTSVLLQDYSHIFANYADISNLVNSYTLPWFRNVCESNLDCVSEVLKPDLSGCAQVGRLWNESHDQMERHKHTLGIIETLYRLFQEGKLQERTFLSLFKTVMPQWLDFLSSLRSEPGKMHTLQEQFRMLFSHGKHPEGLKTFGFIWDMFRIRDPEGMQKALFWLQDLTRLKVPVTYLKHMFEDAFKERKVSTQPRFMVSIDSGSSFDQENLAHRIHRDSTGSLSGYESEAALITQGSMDSNADTQALITLNSSLTRFIVMLDVWLSQLLENQASVLEASCTLHTMLVKMLRHIWGSSHTYQDHKESSNQCLLCRGMELWFGLASKLIQEYARREREDSATVEDDLASPLVSHAPGRSLKVKEKNAVAGRGRKLAADSPDMRNLQHRARMKMSQDSVEVIELPTIATTTNKDDSCRLMDHEKGRLHRPSPPVPRQGLRPPRKLAQVQSHSNLEVVSSFGGVAVGGEGTAPTGSNQEEGVSALYTVFQLTVEKKLTHKLHPDTLLQIIHCLVALIESGHVLKKARDEKRLLADLTLLFEKLWRCMELLTSNVMRSCVGLLLECVDFLCSHHQAAGEGPEAGMGGASEEDHVKSKLDMKEEKEEGGVFWRTLKAGLTASSWTTRYKTIEKLTSILQFMLSSEVVKLEHQSFHKTLKISLARGFCLLTQLLQDKNSSVCTRARYCITSIKESALEAIRHFLTTLFRECPPHRVLVIQTLSLLDSALPEMHFLNLDLLNKLLGMVIHGSTFPFISRDSKKISDSSLTSGVPLLRGLTPQISSASLSSAQMEGGVGNSNPVVVGLIQQLLSLLLRHIGNPRANVKESMKNAHHSVQQQAAKRNLTIKKSIASGTSEEMFVSLLQRDFFGNVSNPFDLRRSSVFEVFLDRIYFVLDHNIEFGHTKGLLPFVLRLLASSAAPTVDDYHRFEVEERQSGVSTGPGYGLGCLPLHMQAPWLRVLFVILYKYIHDYSEVSDSGVQHLVHSLACWCFKITLNTFECVPHDCPILLKPPGSRPRKPSLHRQATIESFGSTSSSLLEESVLSPAKAQGGRDTLTPVLEDYEDAKEITEDGVSRTHKLRGSVHPSSLAGGGRARGGGVMVVNSDLPRAGHCVTCGAPTNEFGEEVMALCAVVIGTYSNRLPHVVPRYLVSRIIPAMTK